ncbi:hypothetical protein SLE2022_152400 [Rubroshorea leprosula]
MTRFSSYPSCCSMHKFHTTAFYMAAVGGLFRSIVYVGCISGCALHSKSRGRNYPHASPKSTNVSYPIRRSKSEGWVAMTVACRSNTSPSPVAAGRPHLRFSIGDQEESSHHSI